MPQLIMSIVHNTCIHTFSFTRINTCTYVSYTICAVVVVKTPRAREPEREREIERERERKREREKVRESERETEGE